MALTVTTDLIVITTAETITGWIAIGAQTPVLEPDFFVQGANCVSRAVSGAGTEKGMVFDNGAGIDFTTGSHKDKLAYIWMRVNTPQLVDTRANGGLKIRLGTGSTTNFREWNVDGSDSIPATDGWICYVIDPQSAGTTTSGSYSAANVRYFGGTAKTTTTAKGQNLGIDQIMYGRGEIYVSGTVATAGAGFKEVADVAYGSSTTNRWGILTEKGGILYCKGKLILGHVTSNTTFSSNGETVVWEAPSYYNGTNVVKTIPDAAGGSTTGADGKTTYNGLALRGGSGITSISFGTIVGADSGRSGSSMLNAINSGLTTPARTLSTLTAADDTISLSIYGSTFQGFEGQVDLTGTGTVGDDLFAVTFDGCGRIDSNMELKNCNILNSIAVATDGAFIWDSATNLEKAVFSGNSRAIVFEAITGTPFTFTNLSFSNNTNDVRNESGGAITINVIGGTAPTVENSGVGSATTLVIDPVTTSLTVKDIVSGANVPNARVLAMASDGTGPLAYQKTTTITRSGATATATCTAHGMLTDGYAVVKGASQQEYNGVFQVTVTDANTFTYQVTGAPATPATGTIVTTGAPLYGLTNTSGFVSATRSFSSNQPIIGKVRKATSGTLYKTGVVSGTISNTTGFSATVQLIRDE